MEKEYPIVVDNISSGSRLDIFLAGNEFFNSRNKVKNYIKNNAVTVNGKIEKASYTVKSGDEIKVTLNEEDTPVILPEKYDLDIVFENDDMLVINKPKNMLTHPTLKELSGTLVNALLYRYGYEGLSNINGILRPGIVHRLDRNTSGLICAAKNNAAHEYLAEKIKTKEIKRKYIAVLTGNFDKKEGIIDAPIGRSIKNPEKMAVVENGKPSVTEYKVLEEFNGYSFVEFNLQTGRTHQIRVHSLYINHPIVNDSLYNKAKFKVKTTEQVLMSYKIEFAPPNKDDIIKLEIPYDADIEKVLRYLRSFNK